MKLREKLGLNIIFPAILLMSLYWTPSSNEKGHLRKQNLERWPTIIKCDYLTGVAGAGLAEDGTGVGTALWLGTLTFSIAGVERVVPV